ncbi:MAG TPA: ferritin-like domain-containing protein [Kofleriaceae bacterium]
MQFRELRRVLQSIVLAGLPACGLTGGLVDTISGGSGECTRTVNKSFTVDTPADPPMQLRIESCRVDVDACMELCSMLMTRAELPAPNTCAVTFEGDQVHATAAYTESTGNPSCGVEGRRPAGLVEPKRIDAPDAVGHWLAHAAWLEAASIPAFIYLARELDAHGAPRGLSRAALAAARDEVRHARVMRQVALRYGATPPHVDVALPTERSLEDLAIENAIEGCVRETWGAVVALWQAHRAQDAELRAIYRGIADDEARHAALGWAIDTWVRTRLPVEAHARIDAAREAAVRELFEGHNAEALVVLGLPMASDARALLARTNDTLWMRSAA